MAHLLDNLLIRVASLIHPGRRILESGTDVGGTSEAARDLRRILGRQPFMGVGT